MFRKTFRITADIKTENFKAGKIEFEVTTCLDLRKEKHIKKIENAIAREVDNKYRQELESIENLKVKIIGR